MNKIVALFIGNDKKDKIVIKNIILSFIIRFFAIILVLVKMPLYINYFDNEEVLGIWLTLLSVLTWIFNFDLGIGNGLRNHLVKALENNDKKSVKEYISSAYISILVLIVIFIVLCFFIVPMVDWNRFFNTSSNIISNEVYQKTVLIVLIGLLFQFLLKLINSVMYALQKSFLPGLFNFISELVLLIIILNINNNISISDKLILIAVLYSVCMCLPLLIANIVTFSTRLKNSKPSISFFSKKCAKSILLIGGMFFWIQIMYMIIVNTNEYLITWFVGPKYVVEYQIYNKIFSLIGTLFTLLLTPIWSMVTKALVNKDFIWINNLYEKLKKMTVLVVALEFFLIIFLQFIINIWLHENAIAVNYYYAILFAISGSLIVWNGVISTIVNGMGKLKIEFITLTIGVLLNIPLAYIFCSTLNSWIGVVLANIISLIPYCTIQPIFIKKYIKNKV